LCWFLQWQKKKNNQPMQQNKMANAAKQKRMAHKGWHQECVLENESDFWGLFWFLRWQT